MIKPIQCVWKSSIKRDDCPNCGSSLMVSGKHVVCATCAVKVIASLVVRNAGLTAELARLRSRIAELETTTYCAYCGEQYPLDDAAASRVSEHIKTCVKHPMRELEDYWDSRATTYRVERDYLLKELTRLRSEREWIPVEKQRPPDNEESYTARVYRGKSYWTLLPPPPTAENKESSTDDDLDRWAAEVEYCKRRAAEYEKEKQDG